MRYTLPFLLSLALLLMACEAPDDAEERPADEWWAAMQQHCGQAFPGGLTLEPEGDEMLDGDELLIAHFRVCEEDRMEIPFHIEGEDEWDRSRTWILTHHGDSLEIRHDHRMPDGTDDEVTMYGGFTEGPGTAVRQEFQSVERTEETGIWRGWRLEVEPNERYTYGTVRGDEWSWRVDFDLTEPMEELPPAPWGHEDE